MSTQAIELKQTYPYVVDIKTNTSDVPFTSVRF
jgi:hypothetical protein